MSGLAHLMKVIKRRSDNKSLLLHQIRNCVLHVIWAMHKQIHTAFVLMYVILQRDATYVWGQFTVRALINKTVIKLK